jgi:hypothetical protein
MIYIGFAVQPSTLSTNMAFSIGPDGSPLIVAAPPNTVAAPPPTRHSRPCLIFVVGTSQTTQPFPIHLTTPNRTPGPPYSGISEVCTKLQDIFHPSLEHFNRDNDNAHFLINELFPWHAPSALPAAVVEGFPTSDMDWAILMEEEGHFWLAEQSLILRIRVDKDAVMRRWEAMNGSVLPEEKERIWESLEIEKEEKRYDELLTKKKMGVKVLKISAENISEDVLGRVRRLIRWY